MKISLANKQDQKGAINSENNLKHQLDIEKLKTKHKIVSEIFIFEKNVRTKIFVVRNYVRHYHKSKKIKLMNRFEKVFHG